MTHLRATLFNCSRQPEFRIQRETMFRDYLLDKLHTHENVMALRERFYMASGSCDWLKHYQAAFNYASKGIGRKEYKQWIFGVRIE